MAKKRRKKSVQGFFQNRNVRMIVKPLAYSTYGALREPVSKANDFVMDKLTGGKYSGVRNALPLLDEGLLLGQNFVMSKLGMKKIPVVKDMLNGQYAIEWSRIGEYGGEKLAQMIKRNGDSGSTSSGEDIF